MSSKGEQQGAAVRGLRSGGCGQGAAGQLLNTRLC